MLIDSPGWPHTPLPWQRLSPSSAPSFFQRQPQTGDGVFGSCLMGSAVGLLALSTHGGRPSKLLMHKAELVIASLFLTRRYEFFFSHAAKRSSRVGMNQLSEGANSPNE